MSILLDTSVAIRLRDGDPGIERLVERMPGSSLLSVISLVELEGGVYRDPAETGARRERLNGMLLSLQILPFDVEQAEMYGGIVASCGFARARILDRMIAATALVADAALATANPRDFQDIPGLRLESW